MTPAGGFEPAAGDAEAIWPCPRAAGEFERARVEHEPAARWFAGWILAHPAGGEHGMPRL